MTIPLSHYPFINVIHNIINSLLHNSIIYIRVCIAGIMGILGVFFRLLLLYQSMLRLSQNSSG